MGVSVKGIYKEVANFYNQKVDPYVDRVKAGVIAGAKEVAKSYTGEDPWTTAGNYAGKAIPAAQGARQGWIEGKKVAEQAIQEAATRKARREAQEAAIRVQISYAVKGAAKGIGWVGWIPDILTFAKGFKQGYSSYGK